MIGEIGQHLFYLTCLSLDLRVLKSMHYWNLVAFVVMCVYREMVQLYICYGFNYAIASLGKLFHNLERPELENYFGKFWIIFGIFLSKFYTVEISTFSTS